MKVGMWVEFNNTDNGSKERAKLSWISPITGKYLFVNRKGLKVADKTVFALATEMRRGSTIVLEEVPLFDRARRHRGAPEGIASCAGRHGRADRTLVAFP